MQQITSSGRILAMGAAIALVTLAAIGWSLSQPGDTPASSLPTRTVQAGAVEVTMTPLTLDRSGAVFRIELDTHTLALDLDIASSAQLRVNDIPFDDASWDGAGPGGHHREGALRFSTPVPAGASVELRVAGLPADAIASWTAP